MDLDRLLAVLDAAREVTQQALIAPSPEAQQSLDELCKAIKRFDTREDNVVVRTRPCEYCQTPIFFARIAQDRFLPFETETVPADSMTPSWRYVVVFNSDPPAVTVRPQKTSGEVYVNHQFTCGAREGPKIKISSLVRRWQVNCERNADVDADVRDRLLAMKRALESQAEDVDTGT